MKGIILAGGKGTRLYPITKAISKQLLPVYNKPMIYYPINTLIEIGIKDILIITTPEDLIYFKNLLINNDDFNLNFEFKVQKKPNGIAEAFIIGEEFIENEDVCLILGDNLFFNSKIITKKSLKKSSKIFVKKVENPNSYGVLEVFNDTPKLIHEKPQEFFSNFAVVGLYMYTSSVIDKVKQLNPSKRGELEITDLNNIYLKGGECDVVYLEDDSSWFDSGTFDSLLKASNFVKNYEKL
jgi:glucose-1-phosphate thymidylyltransferase